MIILFGFILLLACLIVGVRHGGLGLAAVSGIGLAIYVFVIGLVPGKPPIDVMLTIMAVVTCSGFYKPPKVWMSCLYTQKNFFVAIQNRLLF
jgi:hypothetical protein